MTTRQLRETRRLVPLYYLDDYLAGWRRLYLAVNEAGGRATIFRASEREDQFLEFLESDDLIRLLEDPRVAAALEALDISFGEGTREEWEEIGRSEEHTS